MAYRKVDDASLTAVADAIRAKGGTSEQMEFPGGFVDAVEAIQAGGGGNITCGTITPISKLHEIEHSLGTVPKAFIWLVTFNETMSGQNMGISGVFSDEKAYSTMDLVIYNKNIARMVGFVIGEYVYSLSYGTNVDWGFFTRGSINTKPEAAILDETKFKSTIGVMSLLPYSSSGNITINWFAIGGA